MREEKFRILIRREKNSKGNERRSLTEYQKQEGGKKCYYDNQISLVLY